jgi:predicted HAD superfamily Cof-like phosphohydrolase
VSPPDYVADVAAFQRKFGLAYDGPPRALEREDFKLRLKLMAEELAEWESAGLRAEQLDALVDLAYVVIGTALAQGFDFAEAWRRVHEANMRKVRAVSAADSKRGSASDVVKPPGWEAPDLRDLAGEPRKVNS